MKEVDQLLETWERRLLSFGTDEAIKLASESEAHLSAYKASLLCTKIITQELRKLSKKVKNGSPKYSLN